LQDQSFYTERQTIKIENTKLRDNPPGLFDETGVLRIYSGDSWIFLQSTLQSILVCGLILTGCSTVPDRQTSTGSPTSQVPRPALSEPVASEVEKLLREAEQAFLDHRLTTPVDDNAWFRYLRVLRLDPGNERAAHGISDIIDKYMEWALEDIEAGYMHKARKYIARARGIDETHPNLLAVERRLEEKTSDYQETIWLPPVELTERSPALEIRLLDLGGQIQLQNALVVIAARTDAEGRWIYQQLNKADPENRIRAQIRIESRPSLRIAGSQ